MVFQPQDAEEMIVDAQPPGSTKEAKQLVIRKDHTYAALDAKSNKLWAGTFDLDPTETPTELTSVSSQAITMAGQPN